MQPLLRVAFEYQSASFTSCFRNFQDWRLLLRRAGSEAGSTIHVLRCIWAERCDSGPVLRVYLFHSQRTCTCHIRGETAARASRVWTTAIWACPCHHGRNVLRIVDALSGNVCFSNTCNYFILLEHNKLLLSIDRLKRGHFLLVLFFS